MFVGDGFNGIWDDGKLGQAERLVKGTEDREHASTIVESTRTSMLSYTGLQLSMRDGYVDYYLPSLPPPGLTRLHLVGHHATGAVKRLYIDSPSNYPNASQCLRTRPAAKDMEGRPADQVANLRWYFAHAGSPAWSVSDLGREMVRRGFASDGIRGRGGPAAVYDEKDAYGLQESIWTNLDMYESGTYRRTIHSKDVVIDDVFPPDGEPWATPEDFERIRHWRRTGVARRSNQAGHTFVNLTAEFNGQVVHLRPDKVADPARPGSIKVRYALATPPGKGAGPALDGAEERRRRLRVYLEHDWMAEAVLRAMHQAQVVPAPQQVLELEDSHLAQLSAAVTAAADHVHASLTDIARLEADIAEMVPDGSRHVMPAEARANAWDRIGDLKSKLPALQAHERDAAQAAADHRMKLETTRRGLECGAIGDLLASLLDPTDVRFRPMWRAAIRDMKVSVRDIRRSGTTGTQVTFSFNLVVTDGDTTVLLPAAGTHDLHSLGALPARAEALLHALRAGVPLDWTKNANTSVQRRALRLLREHMLADAGGRLAFLQCRVPVLLHLGMTALFPMDPSRDLETIKAAMLADEELVRTFRHPDRLVDRLQTLYDAVNPVRGGWLHKTSNWEAVGLTVAAQNGGLVRRTDFPHARGFNSFAGLFTSGAWSRDEQWTKVNAHEYRLRGCHHCGGYRRAVMAFREVAGYLCLDCHTDGEGVTWPLETFGAYVREPELWNALGHNLPVATDEHYASRRERPGRQPMMKPPAHSVPEQSATLTAALPAALGSGLRNPSTLTPEEWNALLRDYQAPQSIRHVAAVHAVSRYALADLLRAQGLLRPRPSRQHHAP
ncbi:hypothetical protein GCM10009740_13870 [Terrabacter terrae]|uniref:Uncharacterized protein n=1 Tax=Terrabacter terrae TaxID=318434 RepID=A0ABN2U1A4_9MICO